MNAIADPYPVDTERGNVTTLIQLIRSLGGPSEAEVTYIVFLV